MKRGEEIKISTWSLYILYNKFKVQVACLFFKVEVKHLDLIEFSTSFQRKQVKCEIFNFYQTL